MARKKEDLRAEIEKKAKEIYCEMSDGMKVRILDFDLAEKPNKYTIFLVPGFVTVFLSWEILVEILSKDFRVLYFESREKSSSIAPNRKVERSSTLRKMAHDIKEVIVQLELDKQDYIAICSSTGGTILYEALSEKWLKPNGMVAVGPTMEYHIKFISPFLITIVPHFLKILFMPLFRWFLGRFHVDKEEHPKQYAKYVRAGEEAHLRKIRRVLRQIYRYKCWHLPPKVETKTLLIGASTDKVHATDECIRTHELMPNSSYIDLGDNIAAHTQPLADALSDFIKVLDKEK
ncbi:MAG: alpha/beta hydrolase [Candidatus Heimdallarchaeota archaeon]|nr:alpha/beta hydrolase [Candidatus Heimdallarchaeota archaeon]MCK4290377.1 alpha/beta hydrolase [Candidatus Heimdallarchaeota archaeon]